jgi:NAD-dependent dihydropyrimidine dehydrogenase PreA subunit
MRYLKNVVTLELNVNKCLGCGRCLEVCPHGVFAADDMKVRIKDKDACIECGACAKNCPLNAISVKSGVGCAAAVIKGWLTGKEPSCGCSDDDCC